MYAPSLSVAVTIGEAGNGYGCAANQALLRITDMPDERPGSLRTQAWTPAQQTADPRPAQPCTPQINTAMACITRWYPRRTEISGFPGCRDDGACSPSGTSTAIEDAMLSTLGVACMAGSMRGRSFRSDTTTTATAAAASEKQSCRRLRAGTTPAGSSSQRNNARSGRQCLPRHLFRTIARRRCLIGTSQLPQGIAPRGIVVAHVIGVHERCSSISFGSSSNNWRRIARRALKSVTRTVASSISSRSAISGSTHPIEIRQREHLPVAGAASQKASRGSH